MPGEVGVPDPERGQRGVLRDGPAARSAGGLEQGVALLEDPVVVGADAGQPRRAQHQQVVEEARAGPTGSPLTSVRSSGEKTTVRTRPTSSRARGSGRPVDPGPVGPPGVELDLEHRRAPVAHHGRADHRLVGAGADQRRVGRRPGASESRER